MDPIEDQPGAGVPPTSGDTPEGTPPPATPDQPSDQDHDFGQDLQNLQGGSKYTPAQKATFAAKKIAEELRKHGVDPATVFQQKDDKAGDDPAGAGQGAAQVPTAEDIQKMVQEAVSKERTALIEPILDTKIAPITRSDKERDVVKHWAGIMSPHAQSMDEAVEIAWFIANRHRFKDTFAEIIRGKASAGTKTDAATAGAGQRKQTPKAEPTGKEAEFAKSRGLVWDEGAGKFVSPARKAFLDKDKKK